MTNVRQTYNYLQNQTEKNYNVAENYYAQKRAQFISLGQKKTAKLMTNLELDFENYINSKISIYQNQIMQPIINALDNADLSASAKIALENLSEEDEYLDYKKDILTAIMTASNIDQRYVHAQLGNKFENFIRNILIPNEEQSSEIVQYLIDNVIENTGQQISKSFIVSGVKNIRPDIGLNFNFETDKKNSNVLNIKGTNLAVELQTHIDVDSLELDKESKIQNILLQKYLQSNAFGLSLKIWSNPNSREFMQSTKLKQELSQAFYSKNNKTWNSNYAGAYMMWTISRYLINIISPLNIALVTGSKLIWMNDFLNKHRFYMKMSFDKKKKSDRNYGGYEGYPAILGTSIFIRNLYNQNMFENEKYNLSYGVAQSGKLSVKRKLVKK